MSSIPSSLSVSVHVARRACVLSMDLALSRYGLILSQRFSEEFDLWIVREMWRWLDEIEFPKHFASEEDKRLLCESQNSGICDQWQIARIATHQAGLKFFWLGDALRESLLPDGVDPNLLYRYEMLGNSLDLRIEKSEIGNSTVAACRDAVALTAALIPYKGFIFTLLDHGEKPSEAEPAICTYLRKWGINCFNVDSDNKARVEKAWFASILPRLGISEVMWAGLKLAAVHMFVPKAIVFPPMKREEEYFEGVPVADSNEEFLGQMQSVKGRFDFKPEIPGAFVVKMMSAEKDWWEGAMCFWYSIEP
jgi:hypothetical protein